MVGETRADGRFMDLATDLGLDGLVLGACDWLGSVAEPDGAIPLSFPVMERFPRAEHWSDWTYTPALNPTAGIAGRLHRMGVVHPWLDRATNWCWTRLEAGSDEDAHALAEVLVFLANVPDRDRAEAVGAHVGAWPATSSPTAAGQSRGSRRGSPPPWSGAGSRPSGPCGP